MKEYKYDVLTSGYVSMDHIIKIAEPARVGFTSIVTNADNTKITAAAGSTLPPPSAAWANGQCPCSGWGRTGRRMGSGPI